MGNFDKVRLVINRDHRLESVKPIGPEEFKDEHPKGDRLGTPGLTAITHEDVKHDDLVVKTPTGLGQISDLTTEAVAIARLRNRGFDVSKVGIAVPKVEGDPVDLADLERHPEQVFGFFDYFKLEIAMAHDAGIAVVDIKTDMVLEDAIDNRDPVDFSSAILLPEWNSLKAVCDLREKWVEFVVDTKKQVEPNKLAEKLSSPNRLATLDQGEVTLVKQKVTVIMEALGGNDMGKLQSAVMRASGSDRLMRHFLGAKDYVRLQKLTTPELEEKHWYTFWLNSGKDRRNDLKIRKGNVEAAKLLIGRAEELGVVDEKKVEEANQEVKVEPEKEKVKIDKYVVRGIFDIFGLNEHLSGENTAVRILNGPAAEQLNLVREAYNNMSVLAERIEISDKPVLMVREFVEEYDNFLLKIFNNYFAEVVGDWRKFNKLINNRSFEAVRGDKWQELKNGVNEKLSSMEAALKDKNYDEIMKLDRLLAAT